MSKSGNATLPPGWAWATLAELLTLLRNGISTKPDAEHGTPILRISAVRPMRVDVSDIRFLSTPAERLSDYALQAGDLLFTRYNGNPNLTGVCGVVPELRSLLVHPDKLIRARVRADVAAPRFLQVVLNSGPSREFIRRRVRTTAGQAGISGADLKATPVPLAPLPEQHRIVAEIEKHFTRLDAAVAALERVRANLKRYRAAVLKTACEGRLVPTEADLARREGRTYEPAEQLLARILKERRARWEADQLAKMQAKGKTPRDEWKAKYDEPPPPDTASLSALPEGWAWANWEQLSARVTVGHVGPMKHEYVEKGIAFLRSQNVRENRFEPLGLLRVSEKFHRQLAKSVVHPGDLAVVRSGSVGVTCVIPDTLVEANCADLVLIQQPLGVVPGYGSYYMNSLAQKYVKAGQVGIALTHFNTRSVAALPVAVPPLPEQHRIVAEVERRLSVIDELDAVVDANLKRAERLRQAILKRAFEGKLVPQDPNDEPASVLLERIRAGRAAKPTTSRPSGKRAARWRRTRRTSQPVSSVS